MVIGVLLSGIFFGLIASMASLLMGAPVWLAVIAYPMFGAFGAVGFIAMSFLRTDGAEHSGSRGFAVDYYK
ncbi:hypothetical protein [Pseudorhodobacter wandonensis]|jgi:hypothetical protein|uniref:hypothetical protein n=1 Tax=Pseudorhodobacter wandonensis TaxID=1120568 RepID=UPI00067BCBBC|nr:hypothetical protein [Pseudorhodobacter wandonensis]